MRSKLVIASLICLAFGIAVLVTNGSDRVNEIADELVEATAVSPENEGKLVIVSGSPELMDGGVIVDEETGLQVKNALHYSRVPYQKVYIETSREVVVDKGEDKVSTVDDKTRTEYYIATSWINANQKREPTVSDFSNSYENPEPVNLDAYHASGELRISGFKISTADVSYYLQTSIRTFTQEELEAACGEYIVRSEIDLRATTDEDGDGMLSTGDDIGDVHVLFSYETLDNAEPLTLVGRQRGDELVLEDVKHVTKNEQVQPGIVSKEEFLDAIADEDSSSRLYGIGAVVLAVILFLASLDWGGMIRSRKASRNASPTRGGRGGRM